MSVRCQFSLSYIPYSATFSSMPKLMNKKHDSIVFEGVCTIRHIAKNDKWEVDAGLKLGGLKSIEKDSKLKKRQ